jgi:hypothetical protein
MYVVQTTNEQFFFEPDACGKALRKNQNSGVLIWF